MPPNGDMAGGRFCIRRFGRRTMLSSAKCSWLVCQVCLACVPSVPGPCTNSR
jgi:hypothetical protein